MFQFQTEIIWNGIISEIIFCEDIWVEIMLYAIVIEVEFSKAYLKGTCKKITFCTFDVFYYSKNNN